MRRLLLFAAFLVLLTPQAVNACGLCIKNSITANSQPIVSCDLVTNDPGVHADGLSLSAAVAPAHPLDGCPCCPTDTDCTDCVKCAGVGIALVLPESDGVIHVPSTDVFADRTGMPCNRAIARPGRPPQSILR